MTKYVEKLTGDAPAPATMIVQLLGKPRQQQMYAHNHPNSEHIVIYRPVADGKQYELMTVQSSCYRVIESLISKDAPATAANETPAWIALKIFPPAGATVETRLDNGCWYKSYVIGFDEDGNCIVDENKRIIRVSSPDLFRPLTEGREELIVEMVDCLRSAKNINQMYDVTARQLIELMAANGNLNTKAD